MRPLILLFLLAGLLPRGGLVAAIVSSRERGRVAAGDHVRGAGAGADAGAGAGAGAGRAVGASAAVGSASQDGTSAAFAGSAGRTAEELVRLSYRSRRREHDASMRRLLANMSLSDALVASRLELHGTEGRNVLSLARSFLGASAPSPGSPSHPAVTRLPRLRSSVAVAKREVQPLDDAAVKRATETLNGMIAAVRTKYDNELSRCVSYDEAQTTLMEETRQEMVQLKAQSAQAHEDMLAAREAIDACDVKIPETKASMQTHEQECQDDLAALRSELHVAAGDIAVMTKVLESTDCGSAAPTLLQCTDPCTGESNVTLHGSSALARVAAQLRSRTALDLLQGSLASALAASPAEAAAGNATSNDEEGDELPIVIPRRSPCKVPRVSDKRATKCSVGNTNCGRLQDQFMFMQSELIDKRDELAERIDETGKRCATTKRDFEATFDGLQSRLRDANAALARAAARGGEAEQRAHLKGKQNEALHEAYTSAMKECRENYRSYENEECGLTRVRGELLHKSAGTSALVVRDCSVTDWEPEACNVTCGGGVMTLTRSIVSPPEGGVACPALSKTQSCASERCPIDCRLGDWEGWSGCSAECGGGIRTRQRPILQEMKYRGRTCEQTTEAVSCNMDACNADCKLGDWTAWSSCSKACDGGSSLRTRGVLEEARGSGACPSSREAARLQRRPCNEQRCTKRFDTLRCRSRLDVVLVVDGSGSLGKRGWEATRSAAAALSQAFQSPDGSVRLSAILYGGPRSWRGVEKCTGTFTGTVDRERDCHLQLLSPFTTDGAAVARKFRAAAWPGGSTLTVGALRTAAAELPRSGRRDAAAVVIVLGDMKPYFARRVGQAARKLRESARLMWVPVTKRRPAEHIRSWVSEPQDENFFAVSSFEELSDVKTVDHIIAGACAEVA
eukprot:TRINITY_DN30377_c0_g1_i1.p1 TRINITY_DN30377_c0_g1~~TRINITY_DN30377_c0_g1_i1.p1  ORF type:complete len:909 (+),score=203.75 TRINITY_DN30377_c0_g1_i1:75-2801(+)